MKRASIRICRKAIFPTKNHRDHQICRLLTGMYSRNK
uniref:Uncharacterized protein n=1 Tax=Arundo donax TaxID=35708 RepID=A0A0A9GFE1_ARUDO